MSYVTKLKQPSLIFIAVIHILLHITPTCSSEEFNDQAIWRVHDQLESFMNVPIEACNRLERYYEWGGFANDMTSSDRSSIYHFLSMEVDRFSLYFGLEDGTFFMMNGTTSAVYREPGDSGFIVDSDMRPSDPNYKHLISCVNATSGEQTNCILDSQSQYVECINDCELISCANVESLNATSLCRNYEIKPIDDTTTRGYIPSTYFCINRKLEPEQRPGFVLKNATMMELGNCYYPGGDIQVNRTLTGDYAYCGGNGTICNNTFAGGYLSFGYDPRYRDWYRSTKRSQTSIWTAPYVFYVDKNIGITYTRPIYKPLGAADSAGEMEMNTIFYGVIAVDYSLPDISIHLQEQYYNDSTTVFLVERNGQNLMIASSIKNEHQIAKSVLITDESKACSADSTNDPTQCTNIRVPIKDLQESNDTSLVLMFRAFEAVRDQDYPELTNINFKDAEEVGSKAYVTQMQSYTNSNLEWYIFVIYPMMRSTTDAIMSGNSIFYVVIFLASLGFVGCGYLFIKFYSRRKEKAMIHADWRFTCAFILGCANLNLSSYTLLGANTDQTCMLRMWSFNCLFACALSPLFVKVWRITKLLDSSAGSTRTMVNNFQAFLYTLPLIFLQIFILAIFSIVDPPRQSEQLGVGDGMGVQQISCAQKSNAFFVTQLVYDSCLVFVGCLLAFRAKDIDSKFGESKQLGFSMYNIAFTGIAAVTISTVVGLDTVGNIVLQTVSVLWGSIFCSLAFVLPRLIQAQKTKKPISQQTGPGSLDVSDGKHVTVLPTQHAGKKFHLSFPSSTWSSHHVAEPSNVRSNMHDFSTDATEIKEQEYLPTRPADQKTAFMPMVQDEEILFEEDSSSISMSDESGPNTGKSY